MRHIFKTLILSANMFYETFSTQIEGVLNQVVDLNNDVNDTLLDVKAAYAACVGALQVDVTVGIADHDVVSNCADRQIYQLLCN